MQAGSLSSRESWREKSSRSRGCGSLFPPGAKGTAEGAAGEARSLVTGVSASGASRELEPYSPLIRRSGGLEGKMWRPEGNRVDPAQIPRQGGGGREMRAEKEKKERSFQQLPAPGLHINELGCPLWAKRGKSLLSMEPPNIPSGSGVCNSLSGHSSAVFEGEPRWVLKQNQTARAPPPWCPQHYLR